MSCQASRIASGCACAAAPSASTSCAAASSTATTATSSPSIPLNLPARFYDPDDDIPQEECGIFGIFSRSRVAKESHAARMAFFALQTLQHRGQEMAGIATFDGQEVKTYKGMGLVSQIFTEETMKQLPGKLAVGHTRYSTAGGKALQNAQPFVMETDIGQVAIAHNGQLTRQRWLRKLLLGRGTGLFTKSDSEVLAQMLAHPKSGLQNGHPHRSSSPAPPSPNPISPTKRRPNLPSPMSRTSTPSAHQSASRDWPSLNRTLSYDDTTIEYQGAVEDHRRTLLELEEQRGGGLKRDDWQRRLTDLMSDAEGAYALIVLVPGAIYGCRDRHGIRPLCVGTQTDDDGTINYALASESCAFGPIGYTYMREVRPGEIVRLNKDGVTSFFALPKQNEISPALCIFEYVYFARPDTLLENQLVHTVRQRFGRQLARETPIAADIVAGVPDSSIAAAIGYSMQSGIPFMEVLCKNRYIGRTFIQPDQSMRKNSIQLKFNPLGANLRNKRIILVDDSLVRGNTLQQLIPLLKNAGALEVHIRISSPVLRHPCYMGVDIGTYEEILATQVKDVDGMCAYIGADSLQFLSHEGMLEAVREGLPEEDRVGDRHCTACFSGDYPVTLDIEVGTQLHDQPLQHYNTLCADTAAAA